MTLLSVLFYQYVFYTDYNFENYLDLYSVPILHRLRENIIGVFFPKFTIILVKSKNIFFLFDVYYYNYA